MHENLWTSQVVASPWPTTLPSTNTYTVSAIQANLILALCDLLSNAESLAWMHTGFAIRMAQAMRLGQEFHARQSAREKEVRRRTFWACFVMDRLVAFSTGRPITLRLANIGSRLPCPDQDFFFEEEEEAGLYLHDLVENGIARSRLHTLAFYIVAVHLWSSMTTLYVTGRRRIRSPPQVHKVLSGSAERHCKGGWGPCPRNSSGHQGTITCTVVLATGNYL